MDIEYENIPSDDDSISWPFRPRYSGAKPKSRLGRRKRTLTTDHIEEKEEGKGDPSKASSWLKQQNNLNNLWSGGAAHCDLKSGENDFLFPKNSDIIHQKSGNIYTPFRSSIANTALRDIINLPNKKPENGFLKSINNVGENNITPFKQNQSIEKEPGRNVDSSGDHDSSHSLSKALQDSFAFKTPGKKFSLLNIPTSDLLAGVLSPDDFVTAVGIDRTPEVNKNHLEAKGSGSISENVKPEVGRNLFSSLHFVTNEVHGKALQKERNVTSPVKYHVLDQTPGNNFRETIKGLSSTGPQEPLGYKSEIPSAQKSVLNIANKVSYLSREQDRASLRTAHPKPVEAVRPLFVKNSNDAPEKGILQAPNSSQVFQIQATSENAPHSSVDSVTVNRNGDSENSKNLPEEEKLVCSKVDVTMESKAYKCGAEFQFMKTNENHFEVESEKKTSDLGNNLVDLTPSVSHQGTLKLKQSPSFQFSVKSVEPVVNLNANVFGSSKLKPISSCFQMIDQNQPHFSSQNHHSTVVAIPQAPLNAGEKHGGDHIWSRAFHPLAPHGGKSCDVQNLKPVEGAISASSHLTPKESHCSFGSSEGLIKSKVSRPQFVNSHQDKLSHLEFEVKNSHSHKDDAVIQHNGDKQHSQADRPIPLHSHCKQQSVMFGKESSAANHLGNNCPEPAGPSTNLLLSNPQGYSDVNILNNESNLHKLPPVNKNNEILERVRPAQNQPVPQIPNGDSGFSGFKKPFSVQKPTRLQNMYVNNKPYIVLSLLGRGGSSEVYQVLEPSSSQVMAIKCVNLSAGDENIVNSYHQEVDLLSKLQGCSRVIKMFDHEYVESSKMLYVIMEKGDTDFSKLLKDMTKSNDNSMVMIMYYWNEMLKCVKDIHQYGIIHSDLKPANFLLVSGRLKLIDFGISSSLQGDMTSVLKDVTAGTISYMSPEAIKNTGENGRFYKITYKSDIWSLGCILYNMLYGRTPYSHIQLPWAKLQAIADSTDVELPKDGRKIPLEVKFALLWCLKKDPKARPSAVELIKLLDDLGGPYSNKMNWEDLLCYYKDMFPNFPAMVEK